MEQPISPLIDRRFVNVAHHEHLTLLLDLDGTLIPFAATAEAATLDRATAELLGKLSNAGVQIVVVTGRPRALVEPLRAVLDGVWWAAEHGSWTCREDGVWTGPQQASELGELMRVFEPFTQVAGVRIESKSQSLCLHWRQVAPALKDDLIAQCERACATWLQSHAEFEQLDGVEMLEVRHRSANKGRAVPWVRERLPNARILAIGDDVTDDDMFAALREDELAIGVGATPKRARYRLRDPAAVHDLLAWLYATRSRTATMVSNRSSLRTAELHEEPPPPHTRREEHGAGDE